MPNPTIFVDTIAIAARATDVPYADWISGMNNSASNMGIGITTNTPNVSENNWTLFDQHEAPRTPQDSQSVGGVAYTDPANWPSSGGVPGPGTQSIEVVNGGTQDGTNNPVPMGNATLVSLEAGWAVE